MPLVTIAAPSGPPNALPATSALAAKPYSGAGRGAPHHRRRDDPDRLVLVDVDDIQVQDHQQRHQHGRADERDGEYAGQRQPDDKGHADAQGQPEVAHLGPRQLREEGADHGHRAHRFVGRGGEAAALLAAGLGAVLVVEWVAAANAELEPRHVVATLVAGDQAGFGARALVTGHGWRSAQIGFAALVARHVGRVVLPGVAGNVQASADVLGADEDPPALRSARLVRFGVGRRVRSRPRSCRPGRRTAPPRARSRRCARAPSRSCTGSSGRCWRSSSSPRIELKGIGQPRRSLSAARPAGTEYSAAIGALRALVTLHARPGRRRQGLAPEVAIWDLIARAEFQLVPGVRVLRRVAQDKAGRAVSGCYVGHLARKTWRTCWREHLATRRTAHSAPPD